MSLKRESLNKIKNLLSILLLLLGVSLFASCKGDDEFSDDIINVKDVVGTWMCTESIDTFMGTSTKGLLVGKEVTLYENGTFTSTGETIGSMGTWTLQGNQVTAKSTSGTFVLKVAVSGSTMKWEGTANNGVNFKYTFRKELSIK